MNCYRPASGLPGTVQVHTDRNGRLSSVSVIRQLWLCSQGQYLLWSVYLRFGLCLFFKLFDDIEANHHILVVEVYVELSAHLSRVTDAMEKDTCDASKSIKIFVISSLFNIWVRGASSRIKK